MTSPSARRAETVPRTLSLRVFTSSPRSIRGPGDRTFSPVTSSLILGEHEAVLVDSQFFTEDVDALADTIEATGAVLTTIFVTHGHGDHYFGSARLAERFPGVHVVAAKGVVDYVAAHREADLKWMDSMFGDAVARPTLLPSPLQGSTIMLEGHALHVIEVGQGDIAPSTVLHVPQVQAVIAGDVAYNEIHPMLALGGPAEWRDWTASVDAIERLHPATVVAGHKQPDASDQRVAEILGGTRSYIRDFAAAAGSAASVPELVAEMVARYPHYGNRTTLVFSANAAIKARA